MPGTPPVPYLDRLATLPFVAKLAVAEPRPDVPLAKLTIQTRDRGDFVLPLDVRRSHLTKEHAHQLVAQAARNPGLVVFAPAIGRPTGELFEAAGVNFVDLAGNLHLRLGDSYVARVQGRALRGVPAEKGMRPPAYRVLFALLAEPTLVDATTRALGLAAGGVSQQTARDVRMRLVAGGMILETRDAFMWAPGGRARALDMWTAGYASTLYPSLLLGRFRPRDKSLSELEARLASKLTPLCTWSFGGGAGAAILTDYYRGENTLVYVDGFVTAGELVEEVTGLVPDANGPLSFAKAPAPAALDFQSKAAHPLLVYADLLHESSERAWEAAEEIRARYRLGEDL